jgi:hypothetical protein
MVLGNLDAFRCNEYVKKRWYEEGTSTTAIPFDVVHEPILLLPL